MQKVALTYIKGLILIDAFAARELCMKSLEHAKVDTSNEARQDGIDLYKQYGSKISFPSFK